MQGGANGSDSPPGKRNGQYPQRTKPAIAEVPARTSLKRKPPDASIQNISGFIGFKRDTIFAIAMWLDAYYIDEDNPPII